MSDNAHSQTQPSSFSRSDLLFFLIAFVFLYTQLFQLPFTPYYFEGDHLISISNAMRMLGGEVIYRDFFHLTPPGAEVFYTALFAIFGVKVWVLNITILFLGFALALLTLYFSRHFFSGFTVYLPPAIFLVIGFRLFFIDGSYRLFSVVCVLTALAVLINKRNPQNLAIAGALCGLASFFVQPRGVLGAAGISLFLIWENYRHGFSIKKLVNSGLYLTMPFLGVLIITQAFFIYNAGFDNYYFSLVTFLQKHYPSDPLSNRAAFLSDLPDFNQYLQIYSPFSAVSRYFRVAFPVLFFYALVPYIYLVYLLVRWRRKTYLGSEVADAKLMLLCMTGLTLSVGVSAPSVFRLAHVAVPGLVLLIWLLKQVRFSQRTAAVCLAILSLIGVSYIIQRQTITKYQLEMPAGRSAFFSEPVFRRYKWIGEHTRDGEVFYEGHHPSFYFPFHLVNPTPMYLIRDSEYTPIFQVEGVVKALENNPPTLIAWPRKWTKNPKERAVGDNLEILWKFISANYELQIEFSKPLDYTPYSEGDIEIWRRKN